MKQGCDPCTHIAVKPRLITRSPMDITFGVDLRMYGSTRAVRLFSPNKLQYIRNAIRAFVAPFAVLNVIDGTLAK